MIVKLADEKEADALVAFNQAMALETEGKTLDPVKITPGVAAVLATRRRASML